ncbi:hypothetical protein [Streptomyces sp. RTd22]|uniref:hypothetical protein n=1 Tax=Streptomyces sp. RTd22 TaxID=1841249 RepID=UPI0007C51A6C|nr:hypothetical protein [Streptomyces sp. RTd22]
MPSVLLLGLDPRLAPGMDADAVLALIDTDMARLREHGANTSTVLLPLDESTEPTIVGTLAERAWDVVVIGGGIRKPEQLLTFFEKVVNLIRQHAPQAAIAFNTSPGDSSEAAQRWL